MDTTTSMKMTSLAVQSLFSYMEEEDLAAVKAHLDKFRDVDCRSDVSHPVSQQAPCWLRKVRKDYTVIRGFLRLCNKCSVGKRIFTTEFQCFKKKYATSPGLELLKIILLLIYDKFIVGIFLLITLKTFYNYFNLQAQRLKLFLSFHFISTKIVKFIGF